MGVILNRKFVFFCIVLLFVVVMFVGCGGDDLVSVVFMYLSVVMLVVMV